MAADRTKDGSYKKACSILQQLFPRVLTLQEYLEELLADQDEIPPLLQEGDSQEYIQLLQTTQVGLTVDQRPLPPQVSFQQVSNQDEVILRTIEKLCKSPGGPGQNVLSLGYKLASFNSRSFSTKAPRIENVHPDAKIRKFQRRVWKTLLSRIGDDVMTHLLSSCSLFQAGPPSCYIQIAGVPVYTLHSDWHKVPAPLRKIKATTASASLKYTSRLFKNCMIKKKVGHAKKKGQSYARKPQSLLKTNEQQHKQDTNLTYKKKLRHTSKVQQNAESTDSAKVSSTSSNLKRGLKRKHPEESHNVGHQRQKIGRYEDSNNGKVTSENICYSADEAICYSADGEGEMAVMADPVLPSCSHHPNVGHLQRSLEGHHQLDAEQRRASRDGETFDHVFTRQDTDSDPMLTDTSQTRLVGKKWKHCEKYDDREVKRSRQELWPSETGKRKQKRRRKKKNHRQGRRKRKRELKVKISTKAGKGDTPGARSQTSEEISNSSEKVISKTVVLYAGHSQRSEDSILDGLPTSNRGAQKLVKEVFLQDVEKHVHEPTDSTAAATLPTVNQQQAQKCKVIRTPRRYVKVQKLFVELLKRRKQCRYYYLVEYHCPVSLRPSGQQQTEGSPGSNREKSPKDEHLQDAPVLYRRPPNETARKNAVGLISSGQQQMESSTGSAREESPRDTHILDDPVFYRRPPNATDRKSTATENPNGVQHEAVSRSIPQRTDDGGSQEFLMSQHSSVQQIYQLLRSILRKVIPEDLWGSRNNKACFLTNVLLFLRMGRYERISLHRLMTGMRLNDCDWLKLDSNTLLEFQTRRAVLGKLVWWLFNNFVITVLKSYFYITETTAQRNQVLYYRSSVWKMLKDKATEQHLSRHMLSPVSQTTVQNLIRDQQCLGVANLRFVPKKTGLRPVVNMGRQEKTEMNSTGTSINYKLQNLFKVLTYEKDAVPDVLGASVFGINDIYKKWKDFVVKRKASGCTDPLYFVKVDIQHCFDSIPQEKLLQVMTNVLTRRADYLIRRYAKVIATRKGVQCTFEKDVSVLEDFIPNFQDFVLLQNQAGTMYDAIAVDQVCQHYTTSTSLLSQLKQHVQNNVIQIGGTYYLQITGISQGSRLSTLLCSYFYTDMERRYLQGMDTDGLLLRLVDDFLLVTPHLDQATAFLHTMLDGIPEYGCSVHPDKVMTNFPVRYKDVVVACQPAVSWFPWCGMQFHTRVLGVMKDYTKYANLSIRYTLTFDLHQSPGQVMKQKLINTVKAKCHAFFLDPKVNSAAVITQTLYKAFLFTAHQFHCYNTCLPYKCRAQDNPAFFLRMIMDICHYPLILVDAIVAKEVMSGQLPVSQDAVEWLCLQAFTSKLTSHRSVYFTLLKTLGKCLRTLEKDLDCKELQQITSQQRVAEFNSILA
ncbi:TERT [Branchiostoma lanceolatum]|uniref:Telomerase reverse transcriptase n=1 Tax=Branchiostoma lanceolatum TaxID=7740 RepID=A0A8J9YY62_BRALA|nr:TERT [Branchiostoma lanceolatum]